MIKTLISVENKKQSMAEMCLTAGFKKRLLTQLLAYEKYLERENEMEPEPRLREVSHLIGDTQRIKEC